MRFTQKVSGVIDVFLILLILLTGISTITAQNLILNPSCEDTLVDGEIPHWTEIVGSNWTQRAASPDPFAGNYYFFAGIAAVAELQQDVDLSNYASLIDNGDLEFYFEGYVRSWSQFPTDQSRIQLEFLDSLKTAKLDSFDSGNRTNTSAWVQIADTTLAPPETRYIRIRLISTRKSGSNNDGYYDSLSVRAVSVTSIDKNESITPTTPILEQNYPNPFNPNTVIKYQLVQQALVKLTVYDILGREVITLVNSNQPVGSHRVVWDATNYPSGLYFYKLQTAQYAETKKMLLIR